MKKFFEDFSADESGAVTVDWVLLVSVVVVLGFLAVIPVRDGASDLSDKTKAFLDTQRN